ncbi:flippase-like domain-containing protein [Candidatus Woesearchaeota archaeon]|nr:flippase-like domain-containing protein [Candidatus Woesearchaeota archaeon]
MDKKKIRNILLTLVGIAIFIAVYSYIGFAEVAYILQQNLTLSVIVLALALTTINIMIRTYRWDIILKHLKPCKVPYASMLSYTFAGSFLANITPGKVGELGKSYFLKKTHGVGLRYGLSSIAIDKVSDILVTGCVAVFFFLYFVLKVKLIFTIMWMAAFIALIVTVIIAAKIFSGRIMKMGLAKRFMKKKKLTPDEVNQIFKAMASPHFLAKVILISAVLWLVGAYRLMIIGNSIGIEMAYIYYVMVLSISLLIGGLSFIPSGIGINDAVMIFLFNLMGGSLELYGAATLANTILSVVFVNLVGGILLITLLGKVRESRIKNRLRKDSKDL